MFSLLFFVAFSSFLKNNFYYWGKCRIEASYPACSKTTPSKYTVPKFLPATNHNSNLRVKIDPRDTKKLKQKTNKKIKPSGQMVGESNFYTSDVPQP